MDLIKENKQLIAECAGCGLCVNRCDLAEHHMRCDAIAAALRDEDELLQAAGKLQIHYIPEPKHSSFNPSKTEVGTFTFRYCHLLGTHLGTLGANAEIIPKRNLNFL